MAFEEDLEQQLISTLAQYHISPEGTRIQLMGLSPSERISWLQDMVNRVTAAWPRIIGVKPTSSQRQPETYKIHIPNDKLSIRVFPGNTPPDQGMFFFDFVDKDTLRPINAPATYKLAVLIGPLESPLCSMEAAFKVIPGPGQEKYLSINGVRCRLRRPGQPAYDFELPMRLVERRAPEPGVGQAILMDE
ncbi:hypothetical protein FB45DRAFT_510146 [Roridomyces roridus]|uniref:Uncharacterized protein n=1 Tax=Roridomyces roridus TaxID=1738132 RepID=A0AAD7BWM8_9AGAR|nr:hypothetical protein FB45DRAFT_510146 [Roridomyces roridus]